nr:hypothetical protein [uncultured Neokomagataea sp.]
MTFAFPSETIHSSFLAPSEGSPPSTSLSPPSILIVHVDQTLSRACLKDIFEARGLRFSTQNGDDFRPYACFSQASAAIQATIAQPDRLNAAKQTLQHELRTLHGLQLVIAIGVSAHITLMDACGITLNRQTFHPNAITRLPDGLLVAHLPAPTVKKHRNHFTRMTAALDALLPDMEHALALHA